MKTRSQSIKDDVAEIVDNSTTGVLSPEELSKIFSFLPLWDLKNVRLVSRLWRDCSILPSITECEKFVFRNCHRMRDCVAIIMLRSNYSWLNLEFQDLSINSIRISVWQTCGERILTLKLYHCRWNDKTIRNIIVHCENLTSFVIETTAPTTGRYYHLNDVLWPSPTLFSDLVKKGIRRPKLRTFSMLLDTVYRIPVYDSSEIFLLFPRIEHFSIGTASEKETSSYSRWLDLGRPVDKRSRLDRRHLIAFVTRLERFTFNIPTLGEWMVEAIDDGAEHEPRLRYLETMLVYEGRMRNAVLEFFNSQKNLEVLRLGIAKAAKRTEINDFVFRILESCPNLRELHLTMEPNIARLEPSEVPRFVKLISKLKILSFDFDVIGSDPALSYHESLADTVLLNLTTLKWHSCFESNPDFRVAFLQRCSSLQHLDLASCCDASLQVIFKNMLELRTLALKNRDMRAFIHGGGYNFDGEEEGYSIKRLKKLKHLELREFNVCLSEGVAFELQFPRLEYLYVNATLFDKLSEEELSRFASYLPELRVLVIEAVRTRYLLAQTIQFCKHSKNLCRLNFVQLRFYGPEDRDIISRTFDACPSLTYVACSGWHVFWRNVSTGRVLRRASRSFKFSGNYVEGYYIRMKSYTRNLRWCRYFDYIKWL